MHPGDHRLSIEENRQLHSRRQFQIRNSSHSKRRGGGAGNRRNGPLKSPSDLTNIGGKSVISLFTTNSGKTNQSAPVYHDSNGNGETSSQDEGATHVSGSSPLHSKFKESQIEHGLVLKNAGAAKRKTVSKNKIRPVSSLSPGNKPNLIKNDP